MYSGNRWKALPLMAAAAVLMTVLAACNQAPDVARLTPAGAAMGIPTFIYFYTDT